MMRKSTRYLLLSCILLCMIEVYLSHTPSLVQANTAGLKMPFTAESGSWRVSGGYFHYDHNTIPGTQYGLDFARNSNSGAGATIVAPASGTIVRVYNCAPIGDLSDTGYGIAIKLDGRDIDATHFTYIQICHIKENQALRHIDQGQRIGTVADQDSISNTHIHMALYSATSPENNREAIPYEGDYTLESNYSFPKTTSEAYTCNTAANTGVCDLHSSQLEPGYAISIGAVTGQFFQNPQNQGAFTAKPGDTVAFSQNFSVINFNPPSGAIKCSNNTGVNQYSRPFTNVEPQIDGSCKTVVAQGNGYQAGVGPLSAFDAVLQSKITVSGPSQVIFNFYSDDGWILSAGTSSDGAQPSYVSGPLINPPQVGAFTGYSIVGSYNRGSAPTQNNLTVNFPASGTYPFELDYSECCSGELALTLTANGKSIPIGGTISGTVYKDSSDPSNTLAGAFVQVCGTGPCSTTFTSANGGYSITGLASGNYTVTAFPSGDLNLLQNNRPSIKLTEQQQLTGQDIVLTAPVPPPPGTTITNRKIGDGGLPVVYWGEELNLTSQGCASGTATYQILLETTTAASGSMTESSSGTYTARIAPLYPVHGNARIIITIKCPNTINTIPFDIYIDPSGVVETVDGTPLSDATVTLWRSDSSAGPFQAVESRSAVMSVANRANPDTTDANGHFGWDVAAGYYKVRAEKVGCRSPGDSSQTYVETSVLTIPPAVTDIRLQLYCGSQALLPFVIKAPNTVADESTATVILTASPMPTDTATETATQTSTLTTNTPTSTATNTALATSTPTATSESTTIPTYTDTPTSTPNTASCIAGSNVWQYITIPSQTDAFVVEFEATPNSNTMDGVIGLSAGQAIDYNGLAVIARFNSGGYIDARNGANYDAASQISYTTGVSYRFRMEIHISSHTYTIFVTPQGGSVILLGDNFAFRSQQSAVTYLDTVSVFAGSGSHQICNVTLLQ